MRCFPSSSIVYCVIMRFIVRACECVCVCVYRCQHKVYCFFRYQSLYVSSTRSSITLSFCHNLVHSLKIHVHVNPQGCIIFVPCCDAVLSPTVLLLFFRNDAQSGYRELLFSFALPTCVAGIRGHSMFGRARIIALLFFSFMSMLLKLTRRMVVCFKIS